ncbi:hypothetical protein [Rhizobium leguminosarum]|uniref:hypothetical protein n=1 Tax=Rhizobium leguminosarum TaxID=384 RepID=UPI001031F571|nr:hypothetical protein [Rhizobium leguminosarum]TBG03780.1 hypothetical protein ELG82_09615 [Rhizobium leguminosarum]
MSTTDLTMVVDLLSSARVTARATACLANHMTRDGLEEFADDFVAGIDDRLAEIQAEVLYRISGGELEAAAIGVLSARLDAILSPREVADRG